MGPGGAAGVDSRWGGPAWKTRIEELRGGCDRGGQLWWGQQSVQLLRSRVRHLGPPECPTVSSDTLVSVLTFVSVRSWGAASQECGGVWLTGSAGAAAT